MTQWNNEVCCDDAAYLGPGPCAHCVSSDFKQPAEFKIAARAWDRAASGWILACDMAKECKALPGETPLTVAWWLFEGMYGRS